jgi:hypothetical protein
MSLKHVGNRQSSHQVGWLPRVPQNAVLFHWAVKGLDCFCWRASFSDIKSQIDRLAVFLSFFGDGLQLGEAVPENTLPAVAAVVADVEVLALERWQACQFERSYGDQSKFGDKDEVCTGAHSRSWFLHRPTTSLRLEKKEGEKKQLTRISRRMISR